MVWGQEGSEASVPTGIRGCLRVGLGQAWAPGPALGETWGQGLQGVGRAACRGPQPLSGDPSLSPRVMTALPAWVLSAQVWGGPAQRQKELADGRASLPEASALGQEGAPPGPGQQAPRACGSTSS